MGLGRQGRSPRARPFAGRNPQPYGNLSPQPQPHGNPKPYPYAYAQPHSHANAQAFYAHLHQPGYIGYITELLDTAHGHHHFT